MTTPPTSTPDNPLPPPLLDALRSLIAQARQQVMRQVDVVQVQTCWHIGRHIVEFEQDGQARAAYCQRLLPQLGQALSQEFGKGFDERNLRNMRAFFQSFPNWNALRSELSWTHYRLLLRVDNPTVGILLCGSKDQSVVRYSVLNDSQQLFASKYRLVLPSEDELRQELERDRLVLEAQARDRAGATTQ